ncbi:MAG TPA: transposase [Reyranella sp.]
MNILSNDKQVEIIAALTEGVSIRAVERLTGAHRDSVMRLGVRIGEGCAALHDVMMVGLQVGRIELDEIWQYVGKKRRVVKATDSADLGDQYTFIALGSISKAILSYTTGKRDMDATRLFISDLRARVINQPSISTDGFKCYPDVIDDYFRQAHYGQIVKSYSADANGTGPARRYSPGVVVAVNKRVLWGDPAKISTSYVERQNLSLRMSQKRFARLSNGFSKKLRNHKAAVALYVAHYNLCRVHESLRATPAMALGLTDHVWSVEELIAAASMAAPITDRPRFGRFQVIKGGLS